MNVNFEHWKFDNLSENQLLEQADTGDLLLFRGNKAITAITRAVTYSHFDHVAIVLRFFEQPKELFYLEAISSGVQIKRWSNLRNIIGPNEHYA